MWKENTLRAISLSNVIVDWVFPVFWQHLLNKSKKMHNQFIFQVLIVMCLALPQATERSLPCLIAASVGYKWDYFYTGFDGVLQLPCIKGSLKQITSKQASWMISFFALLLSVLFFFSRKLEICFSALLRILWFKTFWSSPFSFWWHVLLCTASENSYYGVAIVHWVAWSDAVMALWQPFSFLGTFCCWCWTALCFYDFADIGMRGNRNK